MNLHSLRALIPLAVTTLLVAACAADGASDDGTGSADVVASSCQRGGLYCGGDKVSGDAKKLYRCDVGGAAEVEACAGACAVHSGSNDACASTHQAAEAVALVKRFYGQTGPDYNAPKAIADMTPELVNAIKHEASVPAGVAHFICSQDSWTAGPVDASPEVDGDDVIVTAHNGLFPDPEGVRVRVRMSDLKIAGYTCGKPKHSATDAHEMVRLFYGDHGPQNWKGSEHVEKFFKEILSDRLPVTKGLTCSKDVPTAISIDPAVELGEYASLRVRERFGPNTPEVGVMLDVGIHGNDMQIEANACAPFTSGGAYWDQKLP